MRKRVASDQHFVCLPFQNAFYSLRMIFVRICASVWVWFFAWWYKLRMSKQHMWLWLCAFYGIFFEEESEMKSKTKTKGWDVREWGCMVKRRERKKKQKRNCWQWVWVLVSGYRTCTYNRAYKFCPSFGHSSNIYTRACWPKWTSVWLAGSIFPSFVPDEDSAFERDAFQIRRTELTNGKNGHST